LVVVIVSAASGFALRAYTRGELELPFDLPIESLRPEDPE